jgi:hypothetical protein
VQNLEALVLDFLDPVTLNIFLQKGKRCLIGLDGIVQVIFRDWLVFPQERANSLDTTSRL